ncbi:hypothetical protein BDD43_0285 [Mucilaginibacter gracilis]|uniref:Uncharacterized protein n=1 Tax=Mucilaginibacter gracilis TaxID=423350 RepID=A0A495IWE1_9SPHI|nr:hypothetical protein BDD43_0285 [Mucilaginibacter gracilis]
MMVEKNHLELKENGAIHDLMNCPILVLYFLSALIKWGLLLLFLMYSSK